VAETDSRRVILQALRAARVPEAPLPELPRGAALPADPVEAFSTAVAAVGGTAVHVAAADLPAAVRELAARLEARRIYVGVPGASVGDVRLEALSDPHELEGVDLAVVPGELAIAENGAVWVDAGALGKHRGVFVVTQHLALVVPASRIVSSFHDAYERLRFDGTGFGVFIAGPSKTADIEQALVIGAHGARSCTVFVVG
jgi:L-lactate dehydrogenase complex protein LldG